MLARRRVNLTMIEADYQMLVDLAAARDKTPSTFALDVIKAAFHSLPKPSKRPVEPLKRAQAMSVPVAAKEQLKQPGMVLNRAQTRMRKKLEAKQTKKKGK